MIRRGNLRAQEQNFADTAARRGRWQSAATMDGGVETQTRGQKGICPVGQPLRTQGPESRAGVAPGPSTPSMSGAGGDHTTARRPPLRRGPPASAHPIRRISPVWHGIAGSLVFWLAIVLVGGIAR